MTSLTEVYDGGVGTAAGRRRRFLGSTLFVLGAAMVVGAIPLATTDLAAEFGLGVYEARELAGVLAGLGVPAVFVGIFTVLPAGRVTRAAAAIGASLAVLAVAVFSTAYPESWLGNDPALAVGTLVLYTVGTLVTFWCLFLGVVMFKRRNEPGGTAQIEVTKEGTVRVVTEEQSGQSGFPGMGTVGLFGSGPSGDVATQTNRDTDPEAELGPEDSGIVLESDENGPGEGRPISDGGKD